MGLSSWHQGLHIGVDSAGLFSYRAAAGSSLSLCAEDECVGSVTASITHTWTVPW